MIVKVGLSEGTNLSLSDLPEAAPMALAKELKAFKT